MSIGTDWLNYSIDTRLLFRRTIAIMISAINTVSIRKKIPSFLTVPLGRIIRLIHCVTLSISSNKAVMGYFVVARINDLSSGFMPML